MNDPVARSSFRLDPAASLAAPTHGRDRGRQGRVSSSALLSACAAPASHFQVSRVGHDKVPRLGVQCHPDSSPRSPWPSILSALGFSGAGKVRGVPC